MSHASCMSMNGWRDYFRDNPDDWVSYLIMADWLEDLGNTFLARAARYMGRSQKRPQSHMWGKKAATTYSWVTGIAPEPESPWPWTDYDAGAPHHLPDDQRKTWHIYRDWWAAVGWLAHRLKEGGLMC